MPRRIHKKGSRVEALCAEVKVGAVYDGKVISIKEFGAFIEIAPGRDGLCHISELDTGYVGRALVVEVFQMTDEGRGALASGKPLAQIAPSAIISRALLPFAGYAAVLLQKQVISATEVLAALSE